MLETAPDTKLGFGEEQAMILHSARAFCQDKSGIAAVRALLGSEGGFDEGVWREMADLGWLGLALPASLGGAGMGLGAGLGATVALAESMGRHLLSTPFFSNTLAAQLLLRAGSAAQREMWLPRLATGAIATPAMLDGEDWGASAFAATADARGGQLRLAGEKWQVQDALAADLFLVGVSVAGDVGEGSGGGSGRGSVGDSGGGSGEAASGGSGVGSAGGSGNGSGVGSGRGSGDVSGEGSGGVPGVVLLEKGQLPDGALSPHTLIDETKRAARLTLDGIEVPASQLLPLDKTPAALRDMALLGALLTAAEATGAAAACLDLTVEYLKTRKQFGKLIGSYQALKHPAVDVLCAVDDARSFIYHAADLLGGAGGAEAGAAPGSAGKGAAADNDPDGAPDITADIAPLDRETEIACRMAKAQAGEALCFASDRAVQFHGAMGFTYECDAQLYLRRAQWARQHYGDAHHHRKRLAPLLLDETGTLPPSTHNKQRDNQHG